MLTDIALEFIYN